MPLFVTPPLSRIQRKEGAMGKLSLEKITLPNWKKMIYYFRRNGLKNTFLAAMERLEKQEVDSYVYHEPSISVLEAQRKHVWTYKPLFSIVVPVYRTPKVYLHEMIDSVLRQTYSEWELILADATEDDSVEQLIRPKMERETELYGVQRIRYIRLLKNGGISENSNYGLDAAKGDYVGLLDHDDVLTPDALYRMAEAIERSLVESCRPLLLYSDEDKCNQDRTEYYEPHHKTDFNMDLLLSNNYICHFMVMDRKLMQNLRFRKEYDGAQDYDLVLRAVASILREAKGSEHILPQIVHVAAVLYHWRCHTGSTAENPQSKQYAYEAGKRALQDMADYMGWEAEAFHRKHLGFYGLHYKKGLFQSRPDIGAVGGRLLDHGRIAAGAYDSNGQLLYHNLKDGFSGYMHRAVLQQDVAAVDVRIIKVNAKCRDIFEQVVGAPLEVLYEEDGVAFDWKSLPEDTDYGAISLMLGTALREAGYRVLWDPEWTEKMRR